MKILLYGINYAPELIGVGKYSGEMGAWLAGRGHEVRVVTAPPYYPAWTVMAPYRATRWQRETVANVRVQRCPLWVPRFRSGAARTVHLASFALSSAPPAWWQAVIWRPDVVISVAPTLASAPAARLAAALAGARSWLHVQDFELDAAYGLGLLKTDTGLRKRVGQFLERHILGAFDRVSTISPRMRERLLQKGVAPERTVLFPNWVDTSEIFPMAAPGALRAELDLPEDAIVALYAGNLGEKQGIEVLLDVAARLRQGDPEERRVVLVLSGEGSVKKDIARIARQISNVRLLPLQPADRLNVLLNLADIHLLPQRADAADLVMPSKLGGMLASGRPVIAAAARGTQIAEEVTGCGSVVAPQDGAAMAAALSRLARLPDERRRLGQAARERAQAGWDKARLLENFERDLRILVDGEAAPEKAAL